MLVALQAPDAPSTDAVSFLHRTTLLLGPERVAALKGRTVAIAGCGGVGGAVALTLTRLGVGGFVLADPGTFDPPDLNRQWAGTGATLGRNKALVHAELLQDVNPDVRLRVFPEGVTADNLDRFLAGADVLVDCLDISVPAALRGQVYRAAQAAGLHAVSAPIFGFGTMMLLAEPGGMGMDQLIEGFVAAATRDSKLPPGLRDWLFGPHVDAVEREIATHRAPTSSVAVTLAAGLVAAEIARIFLRETYPGLGGPVCLPQVTLVEPLRRTSRVVRYDELFRPGGPADRGARAAALARVGHSAVLLDRTAVDADFLTDSWSELAWPADVERPCAPGVDLPAALRARYGYPHAVPVRSGRLAEALVAPLVARPGGVVVGNGLFPTARFHLEAAGARVVDLAVGRGPFAGDLDLDRLDAALAAGDVAAVWIEPCTNAYGGAAVSLANLRAVRARTAGLPVVLDAARIWDNAALLQALEPGCGGRSLAELVHAQCALSDAATASLTKDLRSPVGAFVGVRDPALLARVLERRTMLGDGLSADQRDQLGGALVAARAPGAAAAERVAEVARIGAALARIGAPVLVGGHAVLVDAAAALPHLAPGAHPDQALVRALYLEGGVRVGPHLGTPAMQAEPRWVRVAVPVARPDDGAVRRLVDAVGAVLAHPERVPGLRRVGGAPFAPHFEPLD